MKLVLTHGAAMLPLSKSPFVNRASALGANDMRTPRTSSASENVLNVTFKKLLDFM